ncbi:MAG TPA: gephyrin-like molybdotransferase Glp [Rhizomicrobium sp.]|nr:gephyrin-like molybdotransferase Glp [Rhizomicrobium sp.]
MIAVDEAVARITAAFAPLGTETVPLGRALGRVLVEDAKARLDQPPFPVSAMDGYAVRARDAASVPAKLRVIGTASAGHPFEGQVGEGETVRIFTGGVVPEGADAIVIQEDTTLDGDRATIREAAIGGKHIRKAGLDFVQGDVLARAGQRLRARDLALLAAGDLATLPVRRRPRVAFAGTGDELSPPGTPRKPGGIVASSGYGIAAMIESWGGEPVDLGILPDTVEAVGALPERARSADLIVTIGGASVGDHDLVRTALAPKGFVLDFWKIAMRPGKPLIFGHLGATPFLGLPGNPVSSFVCAILFLKPAIAAMLGETRKSELRTARVAQSLPANDSRQDYLRAHLAFRDGEWWAEPFAVQDSSMQRAFASADCLIVRAPRALPVAVGEQVDVLPLDGV